MAVLTPPPRQPNQCFYAYTSIIAFPPMFGLCTAQLSLSPSFEGLYCWFLLLQAQTMGLHKQQSQLLEQIRFFSASQMVGSHVLSCGVQIF